MFNESVDDRLSAWSEFRKSLDSIATPLESVMDFWKDAPRIIHNHRIDRYNPRSWPTPWDMIVDNRYDDFGFAVIIAYTLKLSNRYKNSQIEVRSMVDSSKTRLYNLVVIDDTFVLNYSDNSVVKTQDIDPTLYLENVVDIYFPR